MDIVIRSDGVIEHMHDDAVTAFTTQLGDVSIRRASHVEPWDELSSAAKAYVMRHSQIDVRSDDFRRMVASKWFVDLSPLAGDLNGMQVFGPFNTRDQALEYEHKWVEQHYLGLNTDESGETAPADAGQAE